MTRLGSLRLQTRAAGVLMVALTCCACGVTSPASGPESSSATDGTPASVSSGTVETPACADDPSSEVELGSPYRANGARARTFFRTDGSTVYFMARRFAHGGALDPSQGVTALYLGPTTSTPSVEHGTGVVSGATVTLTVREGQWVAATLDAGSYWILSSTGGDLVAIGCSPSAVTNGPS